MSLVAYEDRVRPTHVYGTVLTGECRSLNDAMLDAGMLGWNVRQEELSTPDGFVIPTHKAVVADIEGQKRSLGIHHNKYAVVEYRNAFAFGQDILDSSDLMIDSLGYYREGRRGFCSFRVPTEISVGGVASS